VNGPGHARFTPGQLWQALLLKVEDARLFVPGITHCQRVTLYPGRTVEFEHLWP
jgi:hypothetical protein